MAVWLLGKAFTFAYWLLQTLSRLPLIGFVFAAPIILVIVIVNTLVTTLVVAAMAIGTLVFMLNGGRPLDLDFEADAGPVFWKVIVYTFAALAVLDVTAASLSVLYHQVWIRVVFSDLLTWASSIHPLRLLGEVVETVVGWWRALTSPFSFALSNLFNLSDPQWVADVLSIEAICLCLRGHAARAEKPFREALALVTHLKNGKEEEAGIPVKPITRRLHGVAAYAQEARCVGDRQRAGGGERGIFTERVARDERGLRDIDAELALERAHGGEAHRHQRGLSIRGQREFVGRAFEDQPRELFAERFVDLLKHLAARAEGVVKGFAHTGRLASLTGKNEG